MVEPRTLDELLNRVIDHTPYLTLGVETGCEDGVYFFDMLDDGFYAISGTAEKADSEWYVVLDAGDGEQCVSGSGEEFVVRMAEAASGILEDGETL